MKVKLLLLSIALSISTIINATTYYISTTGSDLLGTGSITNPWRTLAKATSTVSTPGDIIHVNAGTYLEIVECFLKPGVNLEGDGVTSVIQSTWPWSYQGVLVIDSPEGTNGNQSVSYLKFDGRSLASPRGIQVQGRSNVSIHHCTIVDFKEEGIVFSGTVGFTGNAPGIYATGNSFHDNIVTNCSQFAGFGTGCLGIGGQDGMLIYNNTITQPLRPGSQIGWPIKYFNEGWLKGVKIYNNTITKAAFDGNGWNFCLELFNFQGLEIYNNDCQGSLDFNFQGNRGTYPWVCYIHDNVIGQPTPNANFLEQGLIFEYDCDGALVENNIFKNIATGLSFYCRPGTITRDFVLQKNLFDNIGYPTSSQSYFIGGFDAGTSNYTTDNFKVYNNTFAGSATIKPNQGIGWGTCNTGYIKNIDVRNNIFENIIYPPMSIGGTATKDNVKFQYNNYRNTDQYGIGTNGVYLPNGAPTNYVNSNNATANPLFVGGGNYTLQAVSTLIDAGTNVGLAYSGTAPDKGYAEYVSGAVNLPPTANAGPDQAITLPTSTVSLTGSGTDPDGTITAYAWTKISGPAAGTITNSAVAATTVTGLVAGVYKFELKVTDNGGAIARDTMQVTVNAAANIPPTANAGPDQTIVLPLSLVTLTGSGTDPDGTISGYAWTKISGPAAGAITNAISAITTVTALVQGVYQFELQVTDNNGAIGKDTVQITVNPLVNIAPTANAGPDQTITLPTSTVTLAGSGTDPDGTITGYAWTKISGPAAGAITNAAAATTTVTGLVQGVYLFELKVTDNSGATDTDTMQVTVNPAAANIPPTANAGPDQTITLPTNTITLAGSGTDPDGSITGYAWTKISGPAAGTITNATAATTTVTGLVPGVYLFELKVTDNSGATDTDTMQVTVNPAGNIPPTANAGIDQTITLPTNTVTLAGSGTDPDGTITTYGWTKISGPAAGTITSATAATTTVTGLVQGVYLFELKVTDNSGATDTDTMQVTVNPAANIPPTANAGIDQTITLPTNTVTLAGSGTDPDGTITGYAWTKISGPAAGTITNAAAATTTVTGLVQGVYKFELKVTDNSGAIARDTMQVTVNPAANIPPTANAGPDQTITLPTNTVTLAGSGVDPDGTITTYAWAKLSGPAAGTITNAAAASTTVTGLVQGVYLFELKVTDNSGATDTDTMQVTVNPAANIPPTANAGIDQLITLPVNTVTLTGAGVDPDGTITAYAWTKIAGPATGTITNATAATTTVTGLTAGIYKFELKVTDNSGATDTDTMQVIVNIAPLANAGPDQNITLPLNAVNLAGSGTDADGTITAYAWTIISGPAGVGTITNPASASTTFTGLTAGVYKLQFKVTDNHGATGVDTMQVVVFSPNIPPVANAGLDQSVTLPTNTANLFGSGTDVDGTIVSYAWTKISGPAGGTIANASLAVTSVSALTAGVYVFQLKVTDNNGASATDIMQVTVNPANIPPVANAGPDQSVLLPGSATLTGSGTDVDGTIVTYRWRQISGPADKLTSLNTAVTVMSNLIAGTYKLELTVTDNKGATGKDTVLVNAVSATPPSKNSAKVYPNPVVDITTVNINSTLTDVPLLIMITDMQGKTVYQKKVLVAAYTINEKINMSNLARGTYFITIFYDAQTKETLKVVKL